MSDPAPIDPAEPDETTCPDQEEQFCNELDKLLHRFAAEYMLKYTAIIGILHMTITRLTLDAIALEEMGEEGEDAAE